ncbi:unnamed protein product [Owenia fusiformis]|uniref:Uncharacterized protein n=1 Tax=Owenia fusiformis TaxID=6347 RepID=A0A8S4MZ34_OWEFU|nr:unnamed protein product [Owenia fusiformis]
MQIKKYKQSMYEERIENEKSIKSGDEVVANINIDIEDRPHKATEGIMKENESLRLMTGFMMFTGGGVAFGLPGVLFTIRNNNPNNILTSLGPVLISISLVMMVGSFIVCTYAFDDSDDDATDRKYKSQYRKACVVLFFGALLCVPGGVALALSRHYGFNSEHALSIGGIISAQIGGGLLVSGLIMCCAIRVRKKMTRRIEDKATSEENLSGSQSKMTINRGVARWSPVDTPMMDSDADVCDCAYCPRHGLMLTGRQPEEEAEPWCPFSSSSDSDGRVDPLIERMQLRVMQGRSRKCQRGKKIGKKGAGRKNKRRQQLDIDSGDDMNDSDDMDDEGVDAYDGMVQIIGEIMPM